VSDDPGNPAEHLKGYRWAKGTSGNPGGRPRGRSFRAALAKVLAEKHNGKSRTELLAEVLFREAIKGKPAAIKELLDRLEGRTTDTPPGADAGARPLVINILPAVRPLLDGRENARVVHG